MERVELGVANQCSKRVAVIAGALHRQVDLGDGRRDSPRATRCSRAARPGGSGGPVVGRADEGGDRGRRRFGRARPPALRRAPRGPPAAIRRVRAPRRRDARGTPQDRPRPGPARGCRRAVQRGLHQRDARPDDPVTHPQVLRVELLELGVVEKSPAWRRAAAGRTSSSFARRRALSPERETCRVHDAASRGRNRTAVHVVRQPGVLQVLVPCSHEDSQLVESEVVEELLHVSGRCRIAPRRIRENCLVLPGRQSSTASRVP